MAQVTVEQLAETVGASVDRLLAQMKDAGLPHDAAEESVSDEDKQTLLAFLKRSHGEARRRRSDHPQAQDRQHAARG
jgi:translation initiation factor IF-2